MSSMSLRVTLSVGAPLGQLGMGTGGYKLARSLASRPERLSALTVFCTGGALPEVPQAAVRRVGLSWLGRALPWTPLRFRPDYTLAICNNAFDLQVARQLPPGDLFYGYTDQTLFSLYVARRKGYRTVLHAANTHIAHVHDVLRAEHRKHGLHVSPVGRWMVWKVQREYAAADLIRAQSSLVAESLIRAGLPRQKIVLVPPAVQLDRFRPLPPSGSDHRFRVCFVGAFDLRKGIQYLLQAWDRLHLPDAELVLHGGAGSRFMRRLLAPYEHRPDVRFATGDPALTYATASVCVVPSIEDGFGYVVLEALASGAPVIVSDQVGARDAVRPGENGFIVPAGDPVALAERLEYLYRQRAALPRMRAAARAVAEMYSYEREGVALHACFEALLEGQLAPVTASYRLLQG